ncbi:hypothetical protein [Brevibacterium otitidis]|uniref:Uncharacterized protein n=1 Tax=Brevibacterium otitidis TaxID=53364 RepID=A0ABV5WZ92_9MICO|nr:hypothetical protein GCM10023233_02120 [Brevibacterium otitidis]
MTWLRNASPGTLMTLGLLVMVGMLLVREFVPSGPVTWVALAGGVLALAFIIPAYIRALLSRRPDREDSPNPEEPR